jgi:hypothetical protein
MTRANALLVVVSTGLAFAAAEGVVRLIDREPPGIYEADATRLYRLVPGAHKRFRRAGAAVRVDINAQGFRGAPLEPDGRARRVVVIGDSFVEAEFSTEERQFTSRLGAELSARLHDRFELVNAGVVGYGPDQELIQMRQVLRGLHPELVLIALYPANDFGDLLRNKLFQLDSTGALQPRGGVLSDSMTAAFEREARPTGWRRSWLLRLAVRVIRQRLATTPPPPSDARAFTDSALADGERELASFDDPRATRVGAEIFNDHYEAAQAVTPDAPAARRTTALMRAVVRAMAREARDAGARVAFVVIPSVSDACARYPFHVDSVAYPAYDRRRLTTHTTRLITEQGEEGIDLWDAFAASRPCELYWGRSDSHWNDEGQALAARVVADRLLTRFPGLPARASR